MKDSYLIFVGTSTLTSFKAAVGEWRNADVSQLYFAHAELRFRKKELTVLDKYLTSWYQKESIL